MPKLTLIFLLLFLHQLLNISDANQPIQAIVVLVLENRSFDHMLGWLKSNNIDGLTGKECNQRSTSDFKSHLICVSDDAHYVDPNPGHSFEEVRDQIFGSSANNKATPTMSGFVEQALTISKDLATSVMKGFSPRKIPVFATLAQEFAIFDRWFSSIPGPTQPNRLFVYSATSYGATSNDKWNMAKGYPQKTIFDSLHEDGLDFNVYFESVPTTFFYRNMRAFKYIKKFWKYGNFLSHAKNGKLASLSVIEPRYFDLIGKPANDDHPSHDIANGQKLIKEVYEALRSSPQWNESLLLITYDEHGGFYDHVQTPYIGIPNPDGIIGPEPYKFAFDRLGVRVPTIAVSPWIKKGTVVHKPNGPAKNSEFEHSSVPATIKKMFNLTSGFLTKRDAWAGTFEGVVSELTSPRTDCPEVLPDVHSLRATAADENRYISDFQSEVVELAAVLSEDNLLRKYGIDNVQRMKVKDASRYVDGAMSRFLSSSREPNNSMGAN